MKRTFFIVIVLVIFSLSAFAALDLKFNGAISINPATPSAGANVAFSVNFMPSGAAVDNLKCTWGIDAANISERTFAHINAETPRTLSFTWVAVAGSHKVWFRLDPEKKTGDINIQNNYIEKPFTVSGNGSEFSIIGAVDLKKQGPEFTVLGSDLKVAVVSDLIISEITITPQNPVTSDKIVVKAVCINIGKGTSKASHVSIKIGGETYPSVYSIGALSPGASSQLQREINLTIAQNYTVTVIADSKTEVTESNENNNERILVFNVSPAK